MTMRVRDANAEDVTAIAAVLASAWRGSFIDFLKRETVEAFVEKNKTVAMFSEMMALDALHFLVCEENGVIQGFSFYHCVDCKDEDEAFAELDALFVRQGEQRRGIGERLLERALGQMKERGIRNCELWVIVPNLQARAFYEKHGFVCCNATKDSGFDEVREIRYAKAL